MKFRKVELIKEKKEKEYIWYLCDEGDCTIIDDEIFKTKGEGKEYARKKNWLIIDEGEQFSGLKALSKFFGKGE